MLLALHINDRFREHCVFIDVNQAVNIFVFEIFIMPFVPLLLTNVAMISTVIISQEVNDVKTIVHATYQWASYFN